MPFGCFSLVIKFKKKVLFTFGYIWLHFPGMAEYLSDKRFFIGIEPGTYTKLYKQ